MVQDYARVICYGCEHIYRIRRDSLVSLADLRCVHWTYNPMGICCKAVVDNTVS